MSGMAIDTFLFSRIGTPLFHRYRVFDRLGSHNAFRKPYMQKLFTFLRESDSESIRRSHRRRAKEIAVSMSKKTADKTNAATETTLTRPAAHLQAYIQSSGIRSIIAGVYLCQTTSFVYANKAVHYGIPSKRIISFSCEINIRANIPIYVANIHVVSSGNTPLLTNTTHEE